MIVYRITRSKYARKLDGKGAAKSHINRWNSEGTEIVYTAESEALARAELGGHINLTMVADLVLVKILIPDDEISYPNNIPEDWDRVPPIDGTKLVGDSFVEIGESPALRVPSIYDETQSNYLINPNHRKLLDSVKILEVVSLNQESALKPVLFDHI